MKLLACAALALLASCSIESTPEEKWWFAMDRNEVYVEAGLRPLVHEKKACPALGATKQEVKVAQAMKGRPVDANGVALSSERERLPLCPQCCTAR
jgi:hypothetical protein